MQIAQTPVRPVKPWTIVGHLDGAGNLEPGIIKDVLQFQSGATPHAHVIMQVKRKPWSLKKHYVTGGIQVAMAAGCTALASSHLYWALGLAPAALLIACRGLAHLRVRSTLQRFHREPGWVGTRTFAFSNTPATDSKRIETAPQAISPSTQVTAEELTAHFVNTMERYPSTYTAVFLAAHGGGYHGLKDFPMQDLATSLGAMHQRSGRKVDLVILESCGMATVEAMRALAPHARYAVASEYVMKYNSALPWNEVMQQLTPDMDPENLGRLIVSKAGPNPTYGLIDLSKLPSLANSVENFGAELDTAFKEGAAKRLTETLQNAHRVPPGLWGPQWLLRRFSTVGDLGDLTDRVRAEFHNSPVSIAAEDVAKRQEECILAHHTLNKRAHGLSIQLPTKLLLTRQYAVATE